MRMLKKAVAFNLRLSHPTLYFFTNSITIWDLWYCWKKNHFPIKKSQFSSSLIWWFDGFETIWNDLHVWWLKNSKKASECSSGILNDKLNKFLGYYFRQKKNQLLGLLSSSHSRPNQGSTLNPPLKIGKNIQFSKEIKHFSTLKHSY